MNPDPSAILDFWFRGQPADRPASPELMRLWFGKDPATDQTIRARFGAQVEAAAAGRYPDWQETARGRLALILLLDQFPRNIYRDAPKAYAWDSQAVALTLAGLDAGHDRHLAIVERAFFYLPLEHAEDLALQQRSLEVFERLQEEAPPALHRMCAGFYDYARRHHEIIARFGRFPHRNAVLSRVSSAAEAAFLRQPGSSF